MCSQAHEPARAELGPGSPGMLECPEAQLGMPVCRNDSLSFVGTRLERHPAARHVCTMRTWCVRATNIPMSSDTMDDNHAASTRYSFDALVDAAGVPPLRAIARPAPKANTAPRDLSVMFFATSLMKPANLCILPPCNRYRWRPQRGLSERCRKSFARAMWTLLLCPVLGATESMLALSRHLLVYTLASIMLDYP